MIKNDPISREEFAYMDSRLANTERALLALAGIMKVTQPPESQQFIDLVFGEYFEANFLLGFSASPEFIRKG